MSNRSSIWSGHCLEAVCLHALEWRASICDVMKVDVSMVCTTLLKRFPQSWRRRLYFYWRQRIVWTVFDDTHQLGVRLNFEVDVKNSAVFDVDSTHVNRFYAIYRVTDSNSKILTPTSTFLTLTPQLNTTQAESVARETLTTSSSIQVQIMRRKIYVCAKTCCVSRDFWENLKGSRKEKFWWEQASAEDSWSRFAPILELFVVAGKSKTFHFPLLTKRWRYSCPFLNQCFHYFPLFFVSLLFRTSPPPSKPQQNTWTQEHRALAWICTLNVVLSKSLFSTSFPRQQWPLWGYSPKKVSQWKQGQKNNIAELCFQNLFFSLVFCFGKTIVQMLSFLIASFLFIQEMLQSCVFQNLPCEKQISIQGGQTTVNSLKFFSDKTKHFFQENFCSVNGFILVHRGDLIGWLPWSGRLQVAVCMT